MGTRIESTAFTTFEISPDGEHVQLNARTTSGDEAEIVLPTPCLNQLLLTLPSIIEAALRRSRNNDSLCLAHRLQQFSLELSERSVDRAVYILTLHTDRDFRVSFAVNADLLGSMAFSMAEQVLDEPAEQARPELNS
jgi:hypothetical protein